MEGLHNWPDAGKEDLSVVYLKENHRHIFHIRVIKSVKHSDRDIEIIGFKKEILEYLNNKYFDTTLKLHNLGARSCEMLAEELCEKFDLELCSVLEDGENGALVNLSSCVE